MMVPLWNRLNSLLLVLLVVMAATIIAMLASRAYGGPLDPPGPVGSTDGVREPGTPISSLPFSITQPGHYYVTRNLTGLVATNGIEINASNVTLDLGGFVLTGPSAEITSGEIGVDVPSQQSAVRITNGTIRGWTQGIQATNAVYSRIDNVSVIGNAFGIETGIASVLEQCMVSNNNATGVFAHTTIVENCTIIDNAWEGLIVYDRSYVHHNQIRFNNRSQTSHENLQIEGSDSFITDNDLSGINCGCAADIALASTSYGNVLVRNTYCLLGDAGTDNYHPVAAAPDQNAFSAC
jgi:hypothetical protein